MFKKRKAKVEVAPQPEPEPTPIIMATELGVVAAQPTAPVTAPIAPVMPVVMPDMTAPPPPELPDLPEQPAMAEPDQPQPEEATKPEIPEYLREVLAKLQQDYGGISVPFEESPNLLLAIVTELSVLRRVITQLSQNVVKAMDEAEG